MHPAVVIDSGMTGDASWTRALVLKSNLAWVEVNFERVLIPSGVMECKWTVVFEVVSSKWGPIPGHYWTC